MPTTDQTPQRPLPALPRPLIIQSDRTLLLDVHAEGADECRAALIPFAELEKSPEHLHTYRLTPLSLWNAASAGFTPDDAAATLKKFSRFEIPAAVFTWIEETAQKFGMLRLIPASEENETEYLYLVTSSVRVYRELQNSPSLQKLLEPMDTPDFDGQAEKSAFDFAFRLQLVNRGTVKQALLKLGWPVKDEAPLVEGDPLEVNRREVTAAGKPFVIRNYQKEAADALVGDKGPGTGFGTIVLPCGAGKTIVGIEVMERLKTNTLIVTTNIIAARQWIAELLDKTTLTPDDISEYTGESKAISPVTVATYQILTWRADKEGVYQHFQLFRKRNWGLIIYDEVHLLPAPVFRVAAELQAVRRVGLTATLVREDHNEGLVFSLVGPKRYDVPWRELEQSGWIAKAECVEVRLDLAEAAELDYAVSGLREQHRIASENPAKLDVVSALVSSFPYDMILVIGQYLDQLAEIAKMLHAPLITGKTPNIERNVLYNDFREGKIRVLVVSKVANFAIDLPDASMAIQVSGTFGSRQEEAQRLGRILRPKERLSRFFTLITRNTVEEEFGANRQKFLAEQGYDYRLIRYEGLQSLEELQGE
jgi:DNA excision repair protein ERCC-3